jgi:DNA polymerase-3 subunit beta
MPSDEFPKFPEYNESAMVTMESVTMEGLIDKTIFSIASDKENLFTLTSVLLQRIEEDGKRYLKMITSDGHRLTIMRQEVDSWVDDIQFNPETLIPRKGIQEIRKFCEEQDTFLFGIEKKQAVLKSEDSLLIIRLMEGNFPDLTGIFQSLNFDNSITIDRLRFLDALKRINLFTEDMFHAIKMEIDGTTMQLSSQNADFGSAKDELEIEYEGESLSLGFNCRYFIETLQVMEGASVQAAISMENSPCCITSAEDEGFLSIIMPMKL